MMRPAPIPIILAALCMLTSLASTSGCGKSGLLWTVGGSPNSKLPFSYIALSIDLNNGPLFSVVANISSGVTSRVPSSPIYRHAYNAKTGLLSMTLLRDPLSSWNPPDLIVFNTATQKPGPTYQKLPLPINDSMIHQLWVDKSADLFAIVGANYDKSLSVVKLGLGQNATVQQLFTVNSLNTTNFNAGVYNPDLDEFYLASSNSVSPMAKIDLKRQTISLTQFAPLYAMSYAPKIKQLVGVTYEQAKGVRYFATVDPQTGATKNLAYYLDSGSNAQPFVDPVSNAFWTLAVQCGVASSTVAGVGLDSKIPFPIFVAPAVTTPAYCP